MNADTRIPTIARDLEALASETRLKILWILSKQPQALAVGALANILGIPATSVSHHLQILFDADFLTKTKEGSFVLYSTEPARLRETTLGLLSLVQKGPDRVSDSASSYPVQ